MNREVLTSLLTSGMKNHAGQELHRRAFLRRLAALAGFAAFPCRDEVLAKADQPSDRIRNKLAAFVGLLDSMELSKTLVPFDDPERENWSYLPGSRRGLTVGEMNQEQKSKCDEILRGSLSELGLSQVHTIISLEEVLKEIESIFGPARDPKKYYLTVFNHRRQMNPWGYRFEGHHISLNFTGIDGEDVRCTPLFLGANPAEIRSGPRQGLRALAPREDVARKLLRSFDSRQRSVAVIDDDAPTDILSGNRRSMSPTERVGIKAGMLSGAQREILVDLIGHYFSTVSGDIAARRMSEISASGIDNIHFAWAGGQEPGQKHYYKIQGPSFLVEYDNTQNNANHIHSVWRDFKGDFGRDLLAEHYKKDHR